MFKFIGDIGLLLKNPFAYISVVCLGACVYLYADGRKDKQLLADCNKEIVACERARVQDYKDFKDEQAKEYREIKSEATKAIRNNYRTQKKLK